MMIFTKQDEDEDCKHDYNDDDYIENYDCYDDDDGDDEDMILFSSLGSRRPS